MYNPGTKVLTLELTAPDTFVDITIPIQASKITLKFFKARLTQVNAAHDSLDFELGPIIGTNFVVDSTPGYTYFKVPLKNDSIGGYNITYSIMNTEFQMAGDLSSKFSVRIRDPLTHNLIPVADMGYICLQFNVDN